jgi:hypothetical protein
MGLFDFIKFKNCILRTNRGEDVLITKNSGSIILIPENKNKNLIKLKF